jgi:Rieske Fe-S protein
MSKISRRDFLKVVNRVLAITGLGVVLSPVVAYFYPKHLEETPAEPVMAGLDNELQVGQHIKIPFGRYPALVIRTEAGLRAYSAVCTHFACICDWDAEKKIIICPCHDGYFDPLDGSVISGPPPAGLAPLQVDVVDGEIYISAGGEA